MAGSGLSRRYVLKGSGAIAATVFASPLRAQAPAPEPVTPALIEAAKKEGKLVFYTAMDLQLAERFGRTFEQRYPGIAVRVERSGAERVFQRIDQEYRSNIRAVDVVNTADQAHCIIWKRNGWLQPYLPEEVAKNYDKRFYDPDAMDVDSRPGLAVRLQHQAGQARGRAEELRRSARSQMGGQDGQGPSGLQWLIMNATFQIARDLGWEYFEKLAKRRVMQVQSATDTPPKISLGERAIMIDGAGYLVIRPRRQASRWM
jgi:iron(III) transport system substrate-binding protein